MSVYESNPVGHGDGSFHPREDAVDLRAHLAPIWRRKFVIVLITVLAAVGAYVLTSREAKLYQATNRLYVQNPSPAASVASGAIANPPDPQALQDVATVITGASNTASAYRLIRATARPSGSVTAVPEVNSSVIDVTATSHSAAAAAQLANAFVAAFRSSQSGAVVAAARSDVIAARATLKALPNIPGNQAQRSALLTQIAQYGTIAGNPSPGASVVDPAVVPTAPIAPRPKRNAAIAGVVGLLLAIGLAYALELFDRRLVRVSTVETLYEHPVVAVIPHLFSRQQRTLGSFLTPQESIEVMRSLRVNLRLAAGGRPLRSVLVTSALPSEGKSTVVRDLAFACADAGERVLVIDCDLRRPSVAHMFGLNPERGLAHLLRREADLASVAVTVFRMGPISSNGAGPRPAGSGDPRAGGRIDIVAHGEHVASPVALLSSAAMSELFATAAATYDLVIVDTSPVLTVSDAVPLLSEVGAVLFVARLGVTTRDAAQRLTELAERVPDMNLVGVVVNDMRGKYPDEGYSSYTKYGESYARRDASPHVPLDAD